MMMMMMIIETLPCHTTTAIGLDHDDKDVGDKDDGTGCDDDEDDDVDVDDDNPNYLLDQPQQLRVLLCLKKAVRTKSIIINTNFSFCPASPRKISRNLRNWGVSPAPPLLRTNPQNSI